MKKINLKNKSNENYKKNKDNNNRNLYNKKWSDKVQILFVNYFSKNIIIEKEQIWLK